jgi:hypothetical protein
MSSIGTLIVGSYGLTGNGGTFPNAQASWSTTHYQDIRGQAAFALLRNWHYAPNGTGNSTNGSGGIVLDEMCQQNVCGWLSAAAGGTLDAPQTPGSPWTQGVYRRRYPNGWVLWNPRGNGVQTIAVGTGTGQITPGLKRLTSNGYGDPSVNSGATLTAGETVTLQDGGHGDGLFLIGGFS